ncbi:SdpI family protein [Terrimonas rubra]|uniref:SdpI family protein n=1 Tax=Terrimonas rubra TaxID=1035890 RepID=A0ABW6A0C0_9BACT
MNKLVKLLIWPVFIAPLVYLAFAWSKLPATVPLHFNFNGQPDRYGSKYELLLPVGIMVVVSIGVYYLLNNLHRIDPKKSYTEENRGRMQRLALGLTLFMSALGCYIVQSSVDGMINMPGNYIVALLGLLFAFLGNYMYTIKPNYFAGFRMPWTLNDNENWRLTHKLAGVLWFAGGLLIALLALVLPARFAMGAFITVTLIITLIPAVYSYRLYANKKKQAS